MHILFIKLIKETVTFSLLTILEMFKMNYLPFYKVLRWFIIQLKPDE